MDQTRGIVASATVARDTAADAGSMALMRESLDTLIRLIERVAPGMRGSVLLLDDDGVTLRHGAAPNLPAAYCAAIDGERIGPAAGSCGTAAYRRERVIVRDIMTDPLWERFRGIAGQFGLAACWSTPIFDPDGRVLGTFAMYYDEPRTPGELDIALTETATLLAANVIRAATSTEALRTSERLLKDSQRQLDLALDASSTSTWRWDMRTNAVEGDERLFELFGVDRASASGTFDVFVSHIHPNDRERVIDGARRCATEGVDLDEEFRIVRPDGSVRWAVDKGKTILGPDGKPSYLIGACVDVTERRNRDVQFRVLAESLPQMAWMADPDGSRYWYNQRWYDYTGTTLEEMRGWGWKAVHHPDHLDQIVTSLQAAWEGGSPWDETVCLRGKDGRYRWFQARAVPIRDADGKVVRWFGSNTDVTERREAELARDRAMEEVKAERQRLYEVFMQAPAAISVLEGPEHIFAVANPRYRELVGDRDLVGKSVREAFPEVADRDYHKLLDQVYTSGEPYSAREAIVRLDRNGDGVPEELYVDLVYQPLKTAAGLTFGLLVHAVEMTEQVRARRELAAARAEADRANKAKSEFLAAMSHDLRTPLNAIGGYAELVREGVYGPVTDAQGQAMARVVKAQKHLLALIHDILSFAKIEAGRLELETASVPVNDILAEVCSMIELQATRKGLTFELRPGTPDVRVQADREHTIQILLNLLTNAVKFTDLGSISLGWDAEEQLVKIHVKDTGRGIPIDRLPVVFEPFVQAGRSTEERLHGVGLGLATSRELARAMKGDVTVESGVSLGSTFTLTLPRSPAPATQALQ